MTITRVTISMPTDLARKLKKAAGKRPVSAWLTELVEERLAEAEYDRLWNEHFTNFPMSVSDRREGDAMFERLTSAKKPVRRRRAA